MSEPVSPDGTIVVVGASLAGLRAAEEIRHEGHTGPVIIVGEEVHAPYDRPPLSKQVLSGKWEVERIHHHTPDAQDALGLEFRLGRRATGLDTDARTVACNDGSEIVYDGLVVATGAATRACPAPRGWPGYGCCARSTTASGSKAALAAAGDGTVVVIGAGFIGSEVAATCQGLGARVTLLEAYHTPLARVLGDEMGQACADLHLANGMDLRCSITIDHLEPDPGGPDPVTVCLDDGTRLAADVVVVGIGVSPSVSWLTTSGLTLDNGVLSGELALRPADRVVAAGGVANWVRPSTGRPARVEHWNNAAEGGAAAARNLVAGSAGAVPYDPVPFFWSDQYTTKIQMIGLPGPDDDVVVVSGSGSEGKLIALYRSGDRLGGVLSLSQPAKLMGYRPLLAAGASFDDALAHSRA